MVFENRRKRLVRPVHPGEMLREDFLPDYELSVKELAGALNVSRQTVNELIREKRSVSPEMAIRLARLFGNSPQFWLNAQLEVDLWDTSIRLKNKIDKILPLRTA
jgi:antitoxin HigA-1